MRAAAFSHFGKAPELSEPPKPGAGPGEVLVEVPASSVNGFDLSAMGGYLKGVHAYPSPL